MVGILRETVDVSEVANFSAVQRQQTNAGDCRKLAFRWLRQVLGYRGNIRFIRKLRRTAFRLLREEGLTSARKSYRRGESRSTDIRIWTESWVMRWPLSSSIIRLNGLHQWILPCVRETSLRLKTSPGSPFTSSLCRTAMGQKA